MLPDGTRLIARMVYGFIEFVRLVSAVICTYALNGNVILRALIGRRPSTMVAGLSLSEQRWMPSRATVHTKYKASIAKILRSCQIDGGLLRALELGFLLIRSNEGTHYREYHWQGDPAGPEVYKQIHHFYTKTNTIEEAKRAFKAQTFIGWEDEIQVISLKHGRNSHWKRIVANQF